MVGPVSARDDGVQLPHRPTALLMMNLATTPLHPNPQPDSLTARLAHPIPPPHDYISSMVETREATRELSERRRELARQTTEGEAREGVAGERRDGKLGAQSVGQVAVAGARATVRRKTRHGVPVPDSVKAVAPMIPAAFCITVMLFAGVIIFRFSGMSTGEWRTR